MPAITILLPVHNAAPFLRETMDSLLCQTFGNFELLAFDDGSTDDSLKILESYDDPRIRIIRHPKQLGLPATLNEGIRLSGAPLIARADADDVYLPDRLQVQYDFMHQHPEIGICGTAISYLDSDKSWFPPAAETDIHAAMLQGSPFAHPSVMFRKSIFSDSGLQYDESLKYSQDYELWIRLRGKTGMANIQQVLVRYRQHSAQISESKQQEQKSIADILRIRLLHELLPVAGPELEALHLRMLDHRMQITDLQNGKASKWLFTILKANEKAGIYSASALKDRLQYMYYNGIDQFFRDHPALRKNKLLRMRSLMAGGSWKRAIKGLIG